MSHTETGCSENTHSVGLVPAQRRGLIADKVASVDTLKAFMTDVQASKP